MVGYETKVINVVDDVIYERVGSLESGWGVVGGGSVDLFLHTSVGYNIRAVVIIIIISQVLIMLPRSARRPLMNIIYQAQLVVVIGMLLNTGRSYPPPRIDHLTSSQS